MIARRCGIRDICAITGYSKGKVQRTIARSNYIHRPKKQHYSELEIYEFHTFIGNKKNKVWLQYAYERESGEIVSFVWGKRDLHTALALKAELKRWWCPKNYAALLSPLPLAGEGTAVQHTF